MTPSLSIVIPVYNFAKFIPETLDSIVSQAGVERCEIVIADGASTDDTESVVAAYARKHDFVKYHRLPKKGGVDRDIALGVSLASGDYCWLFSGDDVMRPSAITRVLEATASGHDVYLGHHMERAGGRWSVYPTVVPDNGQAFQLSDKHDREAYFSSAVNTEAFFSFIGTIVVRRAKWESAPADERFYGSCFAHAARLFSLMAGGLSVRCMSDVLLNRRPDNDSFLTAGIVKRVALSIDGYNRIAETCFGRGSVEAFHVRRVLRQEFPVRTILGLKYMCSINPKIEDKALLNRIVKSIYRDWSYEILRVRVMFFAAFPSLLRRTDRELCDHQEKVLAQWRDPASTIVETSPMSDAPA